MTVPLLIDNYANYFVMTSKYCDIIEFDTKKVLFEFNAF